MSASSSRAARIVALVSAAALGASLLVAAAAAAVTAAGAGGPLPGDRTSSDQVVVRWADGSAGTAFGATADAPSVGARPARVAAVADATGEQATWLRTLAVGGDVYRLAATLGPERMAAAMVDLRARPGIVAAEPDGIVHAVAAPPSDPCWNGAVPCTSPGQWDLYEGNTSTTYGIDLLGAWDRTLGLGVRVAVLDTGITVHPDLAGQTVAGYDFVSSTSLSNDGNGRDPDPSDPGDYYVDSSGFHPSSWHGTHVTGTIAAATGNATGIAGIAPAARVQPLRVLGTGGTGYFSDITDAMVWGSGGAVSGVPANTTPSRVESVSLGGAMTCPSYVQAAVTAAIARGTVVVAAAGNANADTAQFAPANCPGVVAVAATTRAGTKATFSNYGATVAVSAPGVSLWSTLNAGTTAPGAATYRQYSGTSMATPHVSAVAALMIAARPALTPAQVRSLLQQTAHPLATGGCPQGCGAGIVDAARAVAAAAGAAPSPTPTPTATPRPTGSPSPSPSGSPSPTPAPACTRGTPAVTASATTVSLMRGASKVVTLTVRNTDTAACGSSTFTWSVTANPSVAGFTSTEPGAMTVAPGATASSTATISATTSVPMLSLVAFTYRATRPAFPTSAAVTVNAYAF